MDARLEDGEGRAPLQHCYNQRMSEYRTGGDETKRKVRRCTTIGYKNFLEARDRLI